MAMGTGGRETQVSMVSPQVLLIDEADDADSAGQISLICKRTNSWGKQGRSYIASTVNDRAGRETPDVSDPESSHPILMLYREGSKHRAHHRCPHCAGYSIPELEHIDVDACRITCPLCAVQWTEAERIDALNRMLMIGKHEKIAQGVVISGERESDSYSELTTVLDYHMTVLPDICAEIRTAKTAEARGEFSLMRTVIQKMFCRAYVEPAGVSEISNAGLASVSSRSDYEKRLVPSWVNYLVGTVDVQGDRHYWLCVGVGPDDRHCIVDWGYEYLVPKGEVRSSSPADRRRVNHEIDQKFSEGWQQEGREARLSPGPGMRGIDVGYATDEIVNWLRGVRNWHAVRGASKDVLKNLGAFLPLPAEAKAFLEVRKPDGLSLIHI
jgi:phage terminase large subunit GpA-like protein